MSGAGYRRLKNGNEGWLTSYADLITNLLIFFVLMVAASNIQAGKMEKISQALSGQQASESLASAAQKVAAALAQQNLSKDASVKLTDEGLEISFNSSVTFDSGQAVVRPEMEAPLTKVLTVVKPYSAKYHLAVEGHTDEVPMRSGLYKSNWELSSARAMQIRERLEAVGMDPKRLRVEAYADTKPVALDATGTQNPVAGGDPVKGAELDRKAQLARQRRVVIRLF